MAFLAAASLTTCRINDLLTPGAVGTLGGTPAELVDSAFVGSTALRPHDVDLRVDGTGERLRFAVSAEAGSGWLQLGAATGIAPGLFTVTVNPVGLATGDYVDTLSFSAEGPDAARFRVPVRLRVLPCGVTDLGTLPAQRSATLTTDDCTTTRFPDRFTRRFRVAAVAGDSLTIQLGSSAFTPTLSIQREGVLGGPLAESTTCATATAAACLRYVLLATAGNYIIEATSTTARATGAFDLRVGRPRAPDAPTALDQRTAGGAGTAIAVGATITATQASFQAAVADADLDSLRLEVELRPVAAAFTGTATHTSALGVGTLAVTATTLADGTAYKWRARAVDATGRASAWVEFGANASDAADLAVAIPDPPASPTLLTQRRTDGTTDIALGGTTPETSVRLGATVTDPDAGDQVRLEVELRPVGEALTNTATASSVPVAAGGIASVTIPGLTDDTQYRWQARAVDQSGRASAWVRFSPSGATFRVALAPNAIAFLTGPGDVTAGAALAPAVTVEARGATGARLTSYNGPIAIALGPVTDGATLTGTTTVDAVAGVATFSDLVIARAGAGRTLVASVGPVTATSAAFTVTPAVAQALAFGVQPTAAVAGATLAPAVTVIVRDAFGNVATGFTGAVTLGLAPNGAGATLLGTTTVNAVAGIATFASVRVERAAAGLQLRATAAGVGTATSDAFTVSAGGAAATRLVVPPSANAQSGVALATPPVVALDDAVGNPARVAGVTISAVVASGAAATLTNASATTDANGEATFTGLTITGTAGPVRLRFEASGITPVLADPITLAAGGAARLAFRGAPPTTAASGATLGTPTIVRVEDAAGNPVALTGVAVTAAIASGGGTLGGTTVVSTDVAGEAAFTDLSITGLVGARTLAFSAPGLTGITSNPVTVSAGAAVTLTRVDGDGQSAVAGTAVAVPPAVRVTDASGNPVAGTLVTFAITAGGGSVAPTPIIATGTDGIARLTAWTLGSTAGTKTLEARADGLAGSPMLFTATATAGTATQLAITGGNALTGPVGTVLGTAHEVRVTDANGNPVPGVSVNWTAIGGGSVDPAISVTDATGRATTVRTLGPVAGAQSTTAAVTLVGGPAQVTFTLTATVGGATQMAQVDGDAQADTVGATLATPLRVVVRDALNNPVAGVLITWTAVDGGGFLFPASSTTDANGIASAQWILGTTTSPTDSTQLARASGVGSPVNFVATARPGSVNAATTLVAVAPASVAASRNAPAAVTVTARDRFGNVVPGKPVTLTAGGVGNTIVQPAVTDVFGIATGAIGATAAGTRTIVATVDGLVAEQQPTLTVTAAPPAQLVFVTTPTTAIAGTPFGLAPEVGVLDSLGNRNL
ncbi:MAG: Ig-like domain-containing protein, partial [Gemmatimonadaceae bacterium]|nr:Ig-like domain-containing protein [Gemmatimonadaceae bacterium]